MTLVLGAFCADGLLIMSDREEGTTGGGTKSAMKVYAIHPDSGKWWMLIGTAGRASIADLVVSDIANAALANPDGFITGHPDEAYRDVALIIGLRDENGRISLYLTDKEIPWPKTDYACTGVGQTVADYLLEHLYRPHFKEEQLVKLCNFVMRETKDHVRDVGKETDSFFIPFTLGPFHVQRTHDAAVDLTLPKLEDLIDFNKLLSPIKPSTPQT